MQAAFAAYDRDELSEAEHLCRGVIADAGGHFDAHHLLAVVLSRLGREHEALASYDRALAIRPLHIQALSNRGVILDDLRQFEAALASYDRALAVRPDYAPALANRGNSLGALRRFDEALASYDRALAIQGNFADCRFNRALLLLLLGRYAEGWREYEWRRRLKAWVARNFAAPEWRGEDLHGKRLLLYAEQGLGDTIQFARFAPLLAKRGAEIVLDVQAPLGGLLQRVEGAARIVRQGETPPAADFQLPLMSVPFVLGLDAAQIPAVVPYLRADVARVAAWGARLPEGKFRVGIAWQGNPRRKIDRGRSIPLAAFAPLCRVPGVRLISLQKHDGVEQLAALPDVMRVSELGADFDSGPDGFLDSAAVMMHLDLVVTSDSTIAHLAGALGRPVWVILRDVPDWRWMLDRPDTPWYPTARLFRQDRRDDWGEVMGRVAAALAGMMSETTHPPASAATPAEAVDMRQALAAYERGALDEAERLSRAVLAADLRNFEAHHLLAVVEARRGRQIEALASYDRALALRPDDPQLLSNRGVTLGELGRPEEALASYNRALALRPDHAPALSNRGNALRALRRFEEALASYDRALALRPDFPEALSNRGTTLHDLRRYAEAIDSYDKALARRPDYAHALSNRGLALQQLKRFAEALASYDKALAAVPGYQDCHSNRALLLLLLGCFDDGWREYEWRRRGPAWPPRRSAAPEWQGEELRGRRLLLYAEQALGDAIQFARFVPFLAERGGEIIVEVQPSLCGLMQSLGGASQVVRQGGDDDSLPAIDFHLPLMSVPAVLGLDETQIPAAVPYLAADPVRVAAWTSRLPDGEFRIGIAWQGNILSAARAVPLRAFAPLGEIPGVRLISLQKGAGVEQLEELPDGMFVDSLGPDFDTGDDGFLDAAAVMMHLDLVITNDSAVAHLAGALGRPVWILLVEVPDWRWMLGRADTPWYPTARLFRQRRRDDWGEVLARVAAALMPLLAERPHRPAMAPALSAPAASPHGAVTIPAYVICLGRRPDRQQRFFLWNADKGIDIRVFDAVDGQNLVRDALIRDGIIEPDLPFSTGAIGNGLSHKRLWEICVETRQSIIVFEDDAYIPHSLKDWFEPIQAQLLGRCDLLYLGYNRDAVASLGVGDGQWCNVRFEAPAVPFDALARQHDSWSARVAPGGTHCVLEFEIDLGHPRLCGVAARRRIAAATLLPDVQQDRGADVWLGATVGPLCDRRDYEYRDPARPDPGASDFPAARHRSQRAARFGRLRLWHAAGLTTAATTPPAGQLRPTGVRPDRRRGLPHRAVRASCR